MKSNNFLHILTILLMSASTVLAQNPEIYTEDAQEGYILVKNIEGFFTDNSTFYLINNCGQVINTWEGVNTYYQHAKLLPNGNIMYAHDDVIYENNWDNEIVNEVRLDSTNYELDYEIIKLENGNYLSVGRKELSDEEFDDLGYTSEIGFPSTVDVVIEVDSVSGDILWEWDISEHTIQERDTSKANYGIVADHPELLDIFAISTYDWVSGESFMINSFDYNPVLEQVMLSVRKMSEVIIIDRSTTSEESAGHTGGRYGKGGDILYRWGNPGNYVPGAEDERKLYFQHNPKWITQGPHEGKMSVFNNGLNRPFMGLAFSEGPVVDLQADSLGFYSLDENNQYSSGEAFHNYRPIEPEDYFYSSYLSGVEMMPNGNAFFTVGEQRKLVEVNMEGEVVWQFELYFGYDPYRKEKYPIDYPAFANRDLTPGEFLPFGNPNLDCQIFTNTIDYALDLLTIEFLHLQNELLEIKNNDQLALIYQLIDSQGRILSADEFNENLFQFDLSHLKAGFYVLQVLDSKTGKFKNHPFIQTNQ